MRVDGVSSPKRRSLLRTFLFTLASPLAFRASAEEKKFELWKTFQTQEAFLQEAFGGTLPPVATLNVDPGTVSTGSPKGKPQPRLRYWRAQGRTAWIFDDLGKDGYQPTTCGFVVSGGAIEMARVLIYRESRGEQIAERSFVQQLSGAKANGSALDRTVDNISGATYSVKMMERMARTAIALDAMAPAA